MVKIKRIDIVCQQGVRTLENPYDFTSYREIPTGQQSVRYALFKDNILIYTISDSVPVVIEYEQEGETNE
jgi:hypothetical protein